MALLCTFLLLIAIPLLQAQDLANGLVHQYLFNESIGTLVPDANGTLNGTLTTEGTGSAPTWEPTKGMVNGELSFAGTGTNGTYASFAGCFVQNPYNSGMTYSAWIHTTSSTGSIVGQSGNNSYLYYGTCGLRISGGKAQMCACDRTGGVSTYRFVNSSTNINTGKWVHVAGVFYPTNAGGDNKLRIYVNGVLEGVSTDPVGAMASPSMACVGRNTKSTVPEYWTGSLDELRIYSRALSATEIEMLANPYPFIMMQCQAHVPHMIYDTNANNLYDENPDDYEGISRDLMCRSWALTDPRYTLISPSKTNLAVQCSAQINYLNAHRTYSWNGGYHWCNAQYDCNHERFILETLLNALWRFQQANTYPLLISGWKTSVKPAVDWQYSNDFPGNGNCGQYANMDAVELEIMGLAYRLWGTQSYYDRAHAYVESMADTNSLIPGGDGGLYYIWQTNDAFAYHELSVTALGSYYKLTGDSAAYNLLKQLAQYYPKSWLGAAEATSTCFAKHYSICPPVAGVEIIAGVATGIVAQNNRWIAQRTIDTGICFDSVPALYAMEYWKCDLAATAPSNPAIYNDKNIGYPDANNLGGVRGHNGNFSWVGALGRCMDAFVGANIVTSNLYANPSFEYCDGGLLLVCNQNSGQATATYDNTVAHTGVQSVKLYGNNTSDRTEFMGNSYRLPLVPKCNFSVWYKTAGSLANSAVCGRFKVSDKDGNVISPVDTSWASIQDGCTTFLSGSLYFKAASFTPPQNNWTKMSLQLSLPCEAKYIKVELFNFYGVGTVWYDDISLTSISGDVSCFDSALEAVTADINLSGTGYPADVARATGYTTDYPKSMMIGNNLDFASLSVQYRPRPGWYPDYYNPAYDYEQTETDWQVNQCWLLLPNHVVGFNYMESLSDHSDDYVQLRIRTSPVGHLKLLSGATYANNDLRVLLLTNNFGATPEIQSPAPSLSSFHDNDADNLVLGEIGNVPHSYINGSNYTVALDVYPSTVSAMTGYETITIGTSFKGFKVTDGSKWYSVFFNSTTSEQNIVGYTLPAFNGNWYMSSTTTAVQTGTAISGNSLTVNGVPAGAMVVAVQ